MSTTVTNLPWQNSSAYTTASTYTMTWTSTAGTGSSNYYTVPATVPYTWDDPTPRDVLEILSGKVQIPDGRALVIGLPDGARIVLDGTGAYRLEDQDAKVTYRANRNREFNPYLNASDLLADFIRYVGSLGLRRSDIADLPIGLFVNWLVLQAAERDGDPVPTDVQPLPEDRQLKAVVQPRCLQCRRFISRARAQTGTVYDRVLCATRHLAKVEATLHPVSPTLALAPRSAA